MYYLLIGISAVMFSFQFFFNQMFQKNEGTGFDKTLIFSLFTSLVGIVSMLFTNSGKISFSWFSFMMAFFSSAVGVGFLYCSSKAFDKVNLSVYSLFSMLGGMILPVIFGIALYKEDYSIKTVLCVIAIIAALFLGTDIKADKKTSLYCFIVFFLNGMAGVISKIHQSGANAVSSGSFMLMKCIITLCCVFAIILFKGNKIKLANKKMSILSSILYGVINTLANFFILIALLHVNASVQYPMITGGTIAVSVIISIIRKEKVTYKNVISGLIALGATFLII